MKHITAGSKVRLVQQQLIPTNTGGESFAVGTEIFFRVVSVDNERVRVRGINLEAPLGEHVWAIDMFAPADE